MATLSGARRLALALLLLLAGCAGVTTAPGPAPVPDSAPRPPPSDSRPLPAAEAPTTATPPVAPGTDAAANRRARWVATDWTSLPGWTDDQAHEAWPALKASCQRPAPAWQQVCARVARFVPPDASFAREFLQRELQPYRLETSAGDVQGLATGYFEPLLAASRLPQPGYTVPLWRPPADLAQRRPYWTRQQLDSLPAAQALLRGQEIAWLASPLDALLLQIQGSGRLNILEPDGRQRLVRLAFAGHNDQPYQSVGRWLIQQGELRPDQASWPGIRDWGQRAGPERLNQMLWSNPRVVFFREEPLPDAQVGPRGAQGVALTPGRSVAVDPLAVPYGTPLWLDTTEPLSATPLRRLVLAQDTGSAITGAVRVDYFWGWGDAAEQQAGRMKQALRAWALWPRSHTPAAAQVDAAPLAWLSPGQPAGAGPSAPAVR